MSCASEEHSHPPADSGPSDAAAATAVSARETGNLLTLAVHQILLRVGWTFKAEGILVPAFLDTVIDDGRLRGCLPLVSRLGQSIVPVFSVRALQTMRRKKWALALFAAMIGLPYLALAGIWWRFGGQKAWWIASLFLAMHFAFFIFYGLYQVSFGTVQGKLIRPTRRGRLLWGATFVGLFPTIVFCRWLMPGWLSPAVPGYSYLFLFVGGSFLLSATATCLLAEPAGNNCPAAAADPRNSLHEAWQVFRRDVNLRRLAVVIFLFGLLSVTIPHYQSFARKRLGLSEDDHVRNLVLMVITQTTAVSLYSLLVGPIADRWGNRLTLRALLFGLALAPMYVVALTSGPGERGGHLFWMVFILLALAPLVPTILINYSLEMCEAEDHPRYVSLVNLAMMPPFLLSPLVGGLVQVVGFRQVAVASAVLMLLGTGLTFRLDEPRHRLRGPAKPVPHLLADE